MTGPVGITLGTIHILRTIYCITVRFINIVSLIFFFSENYLSSSCTDALLGSTYNPETLFSHVHLRHVADKSRLWYADFIPQLWLDIFSGLISSEDSVFF